MKLVNKRQFKYNKRYQIFKYIFLLGILGVVSKQLSLLTGWVGDSAAKKVLKTYIIQL